MELVLSTFTGAGLMDRGFRAESFCVVSAGDIMWGHDVRDFTPCRHKFDGIIGGPPCQKFSLANRTDRNIEAGLELVHEFFRIVREAGPRWFLMENVNGMPDVSPFSPPGYRLQRFQLNPREIGQRQNRPRKFVFGYQGGQPLAIKRDDPGNVTGRPVTRPGASQKEPCCTASESSRKGRRGFAYFCELQGLPATFDLPGLSKLMKYRLVGNGVHVAVARVIARAIRDRGVTPVRLCVCECGAEVKAGQTLATPACRKRMQRRRDAAAVTRPGPVTGAESPGDIAGVTSPGPVTSGLSL